MIEQILKRFISEDAKLIVAALEKSIDCGEQEYQLIAAIDQMYDSAFNHMNTVDKIVLLKVRKRIAEARRKKRELDRARDIAARVLMGDKFKEERKVNVSTTLGAGYAPATISPLSALQAQQMNAMMQAQQAQAALGNMYIKTDYRNIMQKGLGLKI